MMRAISLFRFIGILGLVLSGRAFAFEPSVYICTTDQATGFYYENGRWAPSSFRTRTFILKYEKDLPNPKDGPDERFGMWKLTEHGEKLFIALCDDAYWHRSSMKTQRGIQINCDGPHKAKMDKQTLRFLYSYFDGYTDGVDNNDNTPTLAIGKCTPL